jgi:nitrous oxidase accessory protein NosD
MTTPAVPISSARRRRAGSLAGVLAAAFIPFAGADRHTATAAATVSISPGQSIQAAVNSHPPGTTFLLRAGTHRNQSVVPKSNDVFLGEAGTILDGGNQTPRAFSRGSVTPSPRNVRIDRLIVQNYAPPLAGGAIDAGGTSGWIIQNCEVRFNVVGSGIVAGTKSQILNNSVHHNDLTGVGGEGDSILVQGNEIAFNNYQHDYTWGFVLGGVKVVRTRGLVARGNYIHDNFGHGFWSDIDNINALYENNRSANNAGAGIFYEISYAAVMRNNTLTGNGFERTGISGGGILLYASRDVEAHGNTLSGNKMGITADEQDRGSGRFGPHLVRNFYVHDNTTQTQGQTGIANELANNDVYTSGNNRYRNNTYTGLSRNPTPFFWLNAPRTVEQWKAFGQDLTGTFNP